MKFIKYILVFSLLICLSFQDNPGNNSADNETDYYTQAGSNRMAAEWEPATGVMITWPLCIPYKLAIELSKDTRLYTLVDNEKTKADAIKWYTTWGIDTSKVKFIFAKQGIDAWWVRDWGPPAIFTPQGKMKLADGKYIYSTPVSGIGCDDKLKFIYKTADDKIIRTDTEDHATVELGKELNMEVADLPYISTGGNVMTDGQGTAFSTCILENENRFNGTSNDEFLALNKKLLGISRYNILPNFENYGIQHIDCFMKLLDEERILVAEPPKDHELHWWYEKIINDNLSKLRTIHNRPYRILRIQSYRYNYEMLSAYTNSLILNRTVYVPLFGIPGDAIALKRWAEVMPGYKIKGFEFTLKDEPVLSDLMKQHYTGVTGWTSGDALHCRTRAVWDTAMLYISVKRIDSTVTPASNNKVFVTIIDYSNKGLQPANQKLHWRIHGQSNWNETNLTSTENNTHYFADIPSQKKGNTIEYYVSAGSRSGRSETMPRTAPMGYYSFTIKNN